ncbi:MAG: hypothetical protein RBR99_03180, partial [Dehalococcoidales bacterium]|nr:hypothetical protein [Dehalococcoidales bacterium]MDX9986447.1 hypothetical protein [Dehalococcoidales bacterium]
IVDLLHPTTIASRIITFHIYLFHYKDSRLSPPRESNMYLNFCKWFLHVLETTIITLFFQAQDGQRSKMENGQFMG